MLTPRVRSQALQQFFWILYLPSGEWEWDPRPHPSLREAATDPIMFCHVS